MHVIIVGCGRVGSTLAIDLEQSGHTVVVLDRDPEAFRRLMPRFRGPTIQGTAFDRESLMKAGIDEADGLVAVTSGDNSNIVAARIARDHFHVPDVIARIYDPDRARIYERHGVTTIATARWTTDVILSHLGSGVHTLETSIGPGEGDVVVLAHDLPEDGGPWEVEAFARQGHWMLTAVTRIGQTTVPVPRQLVRGGERVHLAVQRSSIDEARQLLTDVSSGAVPTSRGEGAAR